MVWKKPETFSSLTYMMLFMFSNKTHVCQRVNRFFFRLTDQARLIAHLTTIMMSIVKEYMHILNNLWKLINDCILFRQYIYVITFSSSFFRVSLFFTITTYITNSFSSFFAFLSFFFFFFGVDQKIWRRCWRASTGEQILFVKVCYSTIVCGVFQGRLLLLTTTTTTTTTTTWIKIRI